MKFLRHAACLLALLLCAAGAAFAQDTATFTGTVRDTSGAVVAGAEVVVSNATIGVTRATVTNNDGEWVTSALPVGTYYHHRHRERLQEVHRQRRGHPRRTKTPRGRQPGSRLARQ